MCRDVRVQILIWFQTFLLFTKPHFQTLNALESTSFQAFQITDALRPMNVIELIDRGDYPICLCTDYKKSLKLFCIFVTVLIDIDIACIIQKTCLILKHSQGFVLSSLPLVAKRMRFAPQNRTGEKIINFGWGRDWKAEMGVGMKDGKKL